MKYFILSILALLSSCTYSITMVHTEGQASDVVDEQQTPSTSVTPTVSIPATALYDYSDGFIDWLIPFVHYAAIHLFCAAPIIGTLHSIGFMNMTKNP